MPGDSGYRLFGMVEVWVLPEWRRGGTGRGEEARVFGVGDLRSGQQEGVDPDAMDGALAVLAGVGAHQEPGAGMGTKAVRARLELCVGRVIRACQ